VSAFPRFLCRDITRSTGCVARVAKRGYIEKKKLDHMVLMARTLAGVIGVTSGRVSHSRSRLVALSIVPPKTSIGAKCYPFTEGRLNGSYAKINHPKRRRSEHVGC
jgi:hypothetical protein